MKLKAFPAIKNIVLCSIVLNIILFILYLSGILEKLSRQLTLVIEIQPVSKIYFSIFILLSLIVPLIYKISIKLNEQNIKILNSYLLFLLAQIVTEVSFILILDKGVAVIVGLLFSVVRLFHIVSSLKLIRLNKSFSILMKSILILWTINIVQILANRIIPLLGLT